MAEACPENSRRGGWVARLPDMAAFLQRWERKPWNSAIFRPIVFAT